jgi:hypothetical protein
MRQMYLSLTGATRQKGGRAGPLNPFEAADRKEAAELRVLDQRMQAESHKYQQQKQQLAGAPAGAAPGATGAAPLQAGGFGGAAGSMSFGASLSAPVAGFGGAATPAATTGGFGGFGATPAATPATGGFGGFGGTPGATATPSVGFGAPATVGFGQAANTTGGKSSFAALDLATPGTTAGGFGGFGAAPAAAPGGFGAPLGGTAFGGGFASSQAPTLGSSNPNRRTKNKK